MLDRDHPTSANPIPSLREAFDAFVRIRRKLKPSTVASYRKYLHSVLASWLDRPFTEITRERVAMRHAEITEQSGPAHADAAMRSLRSILNFAMIHFEGPNGERPMLENPVARLSQTRAWNRVVRRTTFIPEHQLRPWFHAVLELKGTSVHTRDALIADYLLLLILTGTRRSEAASLGWDRVDLKSRTITLRDTHTKNSHQHTLPISDYVFDLLTARRAAAISTHFVFPAESQSGHIVEPRPQMRRITTRSGVAFTLHDLRRTFATTAEALDISVYALKRLLNHKMGSDVTAGYLVLTPERLRDPMQRITDYFLRAAGLRSS